MKLIGRIKSKLLYLLLKKIKPEIIGGFKNSNEIFNSNIGISNFTHVSNKNNNLYIEENVFIGHFNYIDGNNAKITICKNVQITNYVSILTHSSHHAIRLFDKNSLITDYYSDLCCVGEIYIGENCYIGPHTVIMPGTRIGKGSIVSAFSFLKGEYPEFAIIRGAPGKIIGNTKEIDKENLKKYPELIKTYYNKNAFN